MIARGTDLLSSKDEGIAPGITGGRSAMAAEGQLQLLRESLLGIEARESCVQRLKLEVIPSEIL